MADSSSRTLKQKIEDNVVVVFLGTAVAAFGAGWGAHAAIFSGAASSPAFVSGTEWEQTATQKGWIDKANCPAYPLKLRLMSPGDKTSVGFSSSSRDSTLHTDLVIGASRSIPETDDVGFILKVEGDGNYYVKFPYPTASSDRKTFRDDDYVQLPVKLATQKQMSMWAIVAEKNVLGSVYGSLDQITATSPGIVLSEMTSITATPNQ